jgi:predicted Zn-dependent protease
MQCRRTPFPHFLAIGLIFLSGIAKAQLWEVRAVLSDVQQPVVRLAISKDGAVTTVDTIQRVWVQRVATVTERLAPVYGLPAPDQYIVKESGPNAFVTFYKDQPAMFVNTDMLKMVGDDDDMMAAVIGHELGHLKANHLTQGNGRSAAVSLLAMLVGLAVDISQATRGVDTGGLGTQLGALGGDLVNAKFSRDQEREADDIGLRSMASAGFDPKAAPRLWKRMETEGGGGDGLWLSSHPSNSERYQTLQVAAAELTVTPVTAYAIARRERCRSTIRIRSPSTSRWISQRRSWPHRSRVGTAKVLKRRRRRTSPKHFPRLRSLRSWATSAQWLHWVTHFY